MLCGALCWGNGFIIQLVREGSLQKLWGVQAQFGVEQRCQRAALVSLPDIAFGETLTNRVSLLSALFWVTNFEEVKHSAPSCIR